MVENAELVIAYVTHIWDRAYTTYKYTVKKKKTIINLGES